MAMRVPSLMNNAQSLLDLQRIKQAYADTSQQLTTGQAAPNLGDDPSGTSLVLNYQASISLNTQYMGQADTATSQLQSSSTILSSLGTNLNRLLELGQEGLAGTATASSRTAIGSEVDSLRNDLISLGNTQASGKYLFAGTMTTTKPFANAPGDYTTTPPTPDSVTYNGDSGIIKLDLGTTTSVATNIPGNTLFFGPGGQGSATDLLAQTTALRDALNSNDPVALQAAYNNLKTINDRINVSVADLGGRANGVAQLKSGLSAFNSNLTTIQSTVASVDYATAITQLNQESIAQQATLSVMAKANQKSLFDYIA
jgi:flagellar hook-associated protein 3 FlgL